MVQSEHVFVASLLPNFALMSSKAGGFVGAGLKLSPYPGTVGDGTIPTANPVAEDINAATAAYRNGEAMG